MNKKMDVCYIYVLIDPQTNEEFYVGSSIWPDKRLREHIFYSTNKNTRRRIGQIIENGSKPEMHILERVPEKLRLQYETAWIERLLRKGATLTNIRLIREEKIEETQIAIRVSEDLYRRVKMRSAQTGQSISDRVRRCLEEWIEEDDNVYQTRHGLGRSA